MNEAKEGFWAFLEVMGHQKLSGFVTEVNLAGTGFLKIYVPEIETELWNGKTVTVSSFEKLYSPSSVFSITPCTEEIARGIAAKICEKPLEEYGGIVVKEKPLLLEEENSFSQDPIFSDFDKWFQECKKLPEYENFGVDEHDLDDMTFLKNEYHRKSSPMEALEAFSVGF